MGKFIRIIIPVAVLAILATNVLAQGFNQKYNVYLIGQITEEETGAPIENHEISIVSDTINEPSFFYSRTLYTDQEGYYYDTILTTLEKGSLIVSTYDYENTRHETKVHYRFKWEEFNVLFANFALPTPFTPTAVQANFYYARDPYGQNSLEYKFYDITNSTDILFWNWDFGDGFTSDEQNPVHAYAEGGVYKVILTICVNQYGINSFSTITKVINAAEEIYFHMGGHVFAGSFPIDKSDVFLYKIEGEDLIPIDTAIFNDTLGYYLFYQLIEGEYLLKADLHPTSELFNMFMTTYYSDKLHWDEADTIFHHMTNYEYDINLAANTYTATSGPGCIEGQISYDPNYYGGGKTAPAENVTILLYDEYNEPATICHSNEDGQFQLDDLDLQMYYVYAEVTGKYTIPVEVILGQSNSGNQTVQIIIDESFVSGMVSSGLEENKLDQGLGNVFPNPVASKLQLMYSRADVSQLHYSILNYTGQVIFSAPMNVSPGAMPLEIDVSHLKTGVYFIRFTDQNNRTASRKFLKN